MLERARRNGKNQLFDQIERAGREFDSMSEELQNKIHSITGDLEDTLRALDQ